MSRRQQHASDSLRTTGSSPQDSVIRALIQKITTLEFNFAVLEKYSSQISDCYRVVLYELRNTTAELKLKNQHNIRSNNTSIIENTKTTLSNTSTDAKDNINNNTKEVIYEVPKNNLDIDENYLLILSTSAMMLAILSVCYSCILTCFIWRTATQNELK